MKKTVIALASLLVGIASTSFAQELPQPSPAATVQQNVGLTSIEVKYSRPGVKDREIWGELVPYGEIWRTGANLNTTINFSSEVKIAGESVDAGTYSLFIIPEENNATVILNSVIDGWGTGKYDETNNVAKAEAEVLESKSFVESMMIYFDNVKQGSADLVLAWANKKVVLAVEVDYITASLANINKAIEEDGENFRVYNNAASFYLANEIDANKAVEYARKSVKIDAKFWNVKTLSEALAATKNYKEAIKVAKQSLELAQEAEYQPYIKMNEENIAKWSKM